MIRGRHRMMGSGMTMVISMVIPRGERIIGVIAVVSKSQVQLLLGKKRGRGWVGLRCDLSLLIKKNLTNDFVYHYENGVPFFLWGCHAMPSMFREPCMEI